MLQCCLVPYALLFVAFGSRCFYSSLVCLAKCVNVGGEEYKPRHVETKWEQRMEEKSIFLKAFTLIPFGFHFFFVYVHQNMELSSHFKLSHVTHSVLLYVYMYLMCCSIPLIFIIIIHWDPFLFCDPKQMKMQFSVYGIFFVVAAVSVRFRCSLSQKRDENFPKRVKMSKSSKSASRVDCEGVKSICSCNLNMCACTTTTLNGNSLIVFVSQFSQFFLVLYSNFSFNGNKQENIPLQLTMTRSTSEMMHKHRTLNICVRHRIKKIRI